MDLDNPRAAVKMRGSPWVGKNAHGGPVSSSLTSEQCDKRRENVGGANTGNGRDAAITTQSAGGT